MISNAASLKGSVAVDVEAGHNRLVSLYRDMGYEVMQGRDLDRRGMRQVLTEFSQEVEDGDGKIVVHFSGRAVTIGSETLLVPVGMNATDRTGVIFAAVPLTAVLSTAQAREGDTAIILALNAEEDPDFAAFATRPFKVDAPEDALVVY
ncbi:MAG: caspase family protein, partial [Pseudomonadota bacterium]